MSELVTYHLEDRVAVLRMDDGKVNALSLEMIAALGAALDQAEADDARALVLTGRRGKFCAGFDLAGMMAGVESAIGLLTAGGALYLRLYLWPTPLVVACNGHAIAGGALLALTGDHRVGVDGPFKVGLNEVAIQMRLPILALELARDRLDPRRLTEATLLAQLYSPAEAVGVGYLDAVVAADALEADAMSKARALAQLPSGPFAGSKRLLRQATADHIRATFESDFDAVRAAGGR